MIYDLQKAALLKRASAYLLDVILLLIVITGAAFGLSALLGYDTYVERLEGIYAEYEAEYGIDFDISQEEYDKMIEDFNVDFAKYVEETQKFQENIKKQLIGLKISSNKEE